MTRSMSTGEFGVGGERGGQHGDLPAVLGGVLVAVEANGTHLARHSLELVQLEDEVDDLLHGTGLSDGGKVAVSKEAQNKNAHTGGIFEKRRNGGAIDAYTELAGMLLACIGVVKS